MIPFIPDTAATIAYAVALAAALAFAMWRERSVWPLVVVMIGNWLATRAVSSFELSGAAQAVADLTSAALLLAMWRARSFATVPVAGLFALMVFVYGAHDAGLITRDTMWAWADVLGYCQLLIIAGSAVRGGGHPRLAVAADRRRRAPALAAVVARRIQGPPPS
jgi:hypothetical protein